MALVQFRKILGDRSVQGSLRVVRQELEALVYEVSNVMEVNQLKMSCKLSDRPASVYGKWLWPQKAMLEAVERL